MKEFRERREGGRLQAVRGGEGVKLVPAPEREGRESTST